MTGDRARPVGPTDPAAQPECRESLTELYWFLDGELTEERRALIRTHLEACNGCLETYDFEAELRQVVSSCCRERRLPPGLRARVADALRQLGNDR
ncbi:MAG TPA: mycothiol system anti-sigma-R factor [Acidimicrobiales bacterium]|jgi:anti-sigma factor (TIGR02949 family)|nr:mycothiol system anti-sigma-R factor [Acidimicrobiales bacterium]